MSLFALIVLAPIAITIQDTAEMYLRARRAARKLPKRARQYKFT